MSRPSLKSILFTKPFSIEPSVVAIFIVSVSISMLISKVPQNYVFPFFTWRLFDQMASGSQVFDAVLIDSDGREVLLTDLRFKTRQHKVTIWHLVQALGRNSKDKSKSDQISNLLFRHLHSENLKLKNVSVLTIPNYRYVLIDTNQKENKLRKNDLLKVVYGSN